MSPREDRRRNVEVPPAGPPDEVDSSQDDPRLAPAVRESLHDGVVREVEEETGLKVEPLELVELLDRIVHDETSAGKRVRFHYVIADYLCRVSGGALKAASDAAAVRWAERAEWNSHSALALDPITVRVIEAGYQRAAALARQVSR